MEFLFMLSILIFILTNLFWFIFFSLFIFYIHNKIFILKSITKILLLQLNIILPQCKNRRFHANLNQKTNLASLAKILGFNKNFILIFHINTIKHWYNLYIRFLGKSHDKTGRPHICKYVKDLVIKIKNENLKLGYTKIKSQIIDLGYKISSSSVARILKSYFDDLNKNKKGKWINFIKSAIHNLFALDFKVVEDSNGQKYFIMFFIFIFSRKIVHFNITTNPDKKWITQQLRNFTDGAKRIKLITDNDVTFKQVDFNSFNIERIKIFPNTPKMNTYIERFIGTFKREALFYYPKRLYSFDLLYRLTKQYVYYYNNYRHHQALNGLTISQFDSNKKINYLDEPCIKKLKRLRFLDNHHSYYYYKKCA